MASFGKIWSFYSYGRKNFNQRGWKRSERLGTEGFDLTGRKYLVTGANSGIGKCLVSYLFSRGARVYMVCRNSSRGEQSRKQVVEELCKENDGGGHLDANNLRLIIADVALKNDVEGCVAELKDKWGESSLDCVVCNAGAMASNFEKTSEGVEMTFACHFLFGTYWLGKQLLPMLSSGTQPRIVVVTSGGMYTSKLNSFPQLLNGNPTNFNGQTAYANAKRAQVSLVKKWAKEYPQVGIVSAHPGWTSTPGVDKAYGSFSQWLLSPLRSVWEGTEGIAWLAAAPIEKITTGELYLDGSIQPEHLHNSTKVKPERTAEFFRDLSAYDEELTQRAQVAKG